MESNFKYFQHLIKDIGGAFATSNVYFSQMGVSYSAAYKPEYPYSSSKDMIINTVFSGNYELVKYDANSRKFCCEYFETVKDIKYWLYNNKTSF